MTDNAGEAADRTVPTIAVARHWAIPVLLLAGHVVPTAYLEGGVYLIAIPLLLFAAQRLWTALGRRRFFAADQFIHIGSRRRDLALFAVSMLISLVLAIGGVGRALDASNRVVAGDPAQETLAAEVDALADQAADMLDAGDPQAAEDPARQIVADEAGAVLERATDMLQAIEELQAVHSAALVSIIIELESLDLTDDRRALLGERVELVREASRQVCRLHNTADGCAGFGMTEDDVVEDPAERAAILGRLQSEAAEIGQWD